MSIDWPWIVGVALALELILPLVLTERQRRALARHRTAVPAAFRQQLTLEQHHKAVDYARERLRFGQCRRLWRTGIVVALLWGGSLGEWDSRLFDVVPHRVGQPLAFLGLLGLGSWALSLPWQWYGQFHLEARHGFNRSTPAVFWADQFKGLLVGVLFAGPLLAALVWAMGRYPSSWPVMGFALWALFQLLAGWLWPVLIAPLFNTFTPLQNAEITEGLERLVRKAGFQSAGVFVMDASRRSGHGNAYFTGLGRSKRIVFFDTLLNQLSGAQVLAVLAHEIGHLHHRHVVKGLAFSAVAGLLAFGCVFWLQTRTDLYLAFGMLPTPSGVLLMAGWLLPPLTLPWAPALAWWSRRHEYEADRYAVTETSARELGEALLTLHRENASPVVHDAWYAGYYFSHPPIGARLAAMGYGDSSPPSDALRKST
jgi:STE24 endopeptidase